MVKRTIAKMTATLAALALVAALAGCSSDVSPDTGWTVAPDNALNTTALIFTFNDNVNERHLDGNINVIGQGGEVVTGALSGAGRLWSLPVTVVRGGAIRVNINRGGISARPVEVNVAAPAVTATSAAFRPEVSSIEINFGSDVVDGLTSDHIMISTAAGSGGEAVVSGDPSRVNANTWLVPVDVILTGPVNISIEKAGIARQEVMGIPLALMAQPTIGFNTVENAISMTFGANVPDLTRDQVVAIIGTANVTLGTEVRRDPQSPNIWLLPVTVNNSGRVDGTGTVYVAIDRPGVNRMGAGSPQNPAPVTVLPITFTAAIFTPPLAPGAATGVAMPGSSRVDFVFSAAITSFTPSIPTEAGTTDGRGTFGTPVGSGRNWSVPFTPVSAGALTIAVTATVPAGVTVGRVSAGTVVQPTN